MRKKLLPLMVLLLFVLSALSVNVTWVSAVESPCIKVVPESTKTTTVTVGMLYTVSIYTDYAGSDVASYQFNMSYDPSILEGYEVANGDLIVGGSAKFGAGVFDNVAGKLSLTVGFYFNEGEVTSGPGTLATVTFRVIGIGLSNIAIGDGTKLIGWDIWNGIETYIIDAALMPTHIQHGLFDNSGAKAYPPYPPVAVIDALLDSYANEPATFSGASSYDPDGTAIISYKWDYGDGTPPVVTTDSTVIHTYTTIGIYTVTLVVIDAQNQVGDPTYFSVNVKERPPYLADLVKWKVKPEAHHWVYSKDEDKLVTLTALARNQGSNPVNVSITFAIIDAASGTSAGPDIVADATLEFNPYEDVPISVKLNPNNYGYDGTTKRVLYAHVTLRYDSNADGTPDTATKTKICRFTIIP